jgi:hypothetical protein
MRASIKTLLDQYQIRKTYKQKQAFIEFMRSHAYEHGYKLEEQHYKRGRGKNLMVGNPETAEVIVTAHYDTPPNALMPIATVVGNVPMYIISQFLVFLPVLVVFWILQLLITVIFGGIGIFAAPTFFFGLQISLFMLIMLILWCFQMMMGIANKNNANDNTSGVSVLLSLLEDLPRDQRSKVCFVFFDEEEKGLEGSKSFKKFYFEDIRHKPLINFDCVGYGKHLMFITKKEFRESKFNQLLTETTNGKALMKEARHYVYASDQLIFKNSVGVAALHKTPILGYCLSRLHSRFDNRFSSDNIEELNQIMIKFIEKI